MATVENLLCILGAAIPFGIVLLKSYDINNNVKPAGLNSTDQLPPLKSTVISILRKYLLPDLVNIITSMVIPSELWINERIRGSFSVCNPFWNFYSGLHPFLICGHTTCISTIGQNIYAFLPGDRNIYVLNLSTLTHSIIECCTADVTFAFASGPDLYTFNNKLLGYRRNTNSCQELSIRGPILWTSHRADLHQGIGIDYDNIRGAIILDRKGLLLKQYNNNNDYGWYCFCINCLFDQMVQLDKYLIIMQIIEYPWHTQLCCWKLNLDEHQCCTYLDGHNWTKLPIIEFPKQVRLSEMKNFIKLTIVDGKLALVPTLMSTLTCMYEFDVFKPQSNWVEHEISHLHKLVLDTAKRVPWI